MISMNQLIPGRMPLWLAWALAIALVPFALGGIAYIAANTPADRPLYVGLLTGSLVAAPVAAWRKGRRWWLWLLMGLGALLVMAFLLGPFFQPITVAVAALLVERKPMGPPTRLAAPLVPSQWQSSTAQGIAGTDEDSLGPEDISTPPEPESQRQGQPKRLRPRRGRRR